MKKILIMILIMLFNLACSGGAKKQIAERERIALCDEGYLKYLDFEGKEVSKIKLPLHAKDFRIHGHYICFVGFDENLRLLNLINMKGINIPPGPYFHKNEMMISFANIKNEGEHIRDIDFRVDEGIIVFIARPDVSHWTFSDGFKSTYECKDFQGCSDTIVYDIKKRKAICISKEENDGLSGYCSKPFVHKMKVAYNYLGREIYFIDIKQRKEERDINKDFIKYYKKKEEAALLNVFSIKDDLLYFINTEYDNSVTEQKYLPENAIEEVYVYHLKKHDFVKLDDLKGMRILGYPWDRVLDISRDQKYILMNEGFYQLYLGGIKDKSKKKIYEFKDNSCFTAQFIDK